MFGKSWTILHVRGIPIRIHVSLLLFLPYVAFVATVQYRTLARQLGVDLAASALPAAAWGILLAVGLFVAVTLHELGHSFVALKNGIRVRSITLLMLGGISSIEGDASPGREAWMAFAGPLVSFLLALLAFIGYRLSLAAPDLAVALLAFAITNAVVGVFNLLPAFPMDGGRVLRGLLARRFGIVRATAVATRTGQVLAIALAIWAFLNFNVMLMLIAAFIFTGASAERARFNTRDTLHGIPVSRFMNDRLGEAWPDEAAADVAKRFLVNNWVGARVVPTTRTGKRVDMPPLAVITAPDLLPERNAPGARVADRVRADLPKVRTDEDAARALELFLGGQAKAMLVVDENQNVVGVLTPAEVQRAITLASAIDHRTRSTD